MVRESWKQIPSYRTQNPDCSGRLGNTDISHFSCKELRRDIWKENLTKSQLIWIYCTRIYIIFDEKLSLKFRIYNSKNGIQIDYFNTIAQRSNLTTGQNFKLRLLNSNLKKGSQNQQHWVLDVINIDTKISCFFFCRFEIDPLRIEYTVNRNVKFRSGSKLRLDVFRPEFWCALYRNNTQLGSCNLNVPDLDEIFYQMNFFMA